MTLEIMMIDDDADEIQLARLLLERRSQSISISAYLDPEEAIDELKRRVAAKEAGPSFVSVDINMPLHDGIDLARSVRPICETLATPLGILTGSDSQADKAAAVAAGVDFFAVKPLNYEALAQIGDELGAFSVARRDKSIEVIERSATKQGASAAARQDRKTGRDGRPRSA